jgi:hypothetical protein
MIDPSGIIKKILFEISGAKIALYPNSFIETVEMRKSYLNKKKFPACGLDHNF